MVLHRQGSESSVNQGDPRPQVICADGIPLDSESSESEHEIDSDLEDELEDLDFLEEEIDPEEAMGIVDELSDVSMLDDAVSSYADSNFHSDYDRESFDVAAYRSEGDESSHYVPDGTPPISPEPQYDARYERLRSRYAPTEDRDPTIRPYMPRLEHPVIVPPRYTDPSLYAFADHPCFDQPSPSQPSTSRQRVPDPDMAGPSGTKPVELARSSEKDREKVVKWKKVIEFRVRELGKYINRERNQHQKVYLDFFDAILQLYIDYSDDGLDLDEIYTIDEWHRFMMREILPLTPEWLRGLMKYVTDSPADSVWDWIFGIRQYTRQNILQ